jgi:hypothetical protein
MGLFGLLNYEDYILNTIIKSEYARNSLVLFSMCIITAIVRFHISIAICLFITGGPIFDLVFPVVVTVLLSMISDTLFKYVETHKPWHESVVDYLMNNYSKKNYSRWKRILLLVLLIYILIAIALIQIDNYFILLSALQTTASFLITDLLEHKMPQKWYNHMVNLLVTPTVKRFQTNNQIIENYSQNIYPEVKSISNKENRKSQTELSNRKSQTELSNRKSQTELTNRKSQTELTNRKSQTELSNRKSQSLESGLIYNLNTVSPSKKIKIFTHDTISEINNYQTENKDLVEVQSPELLDIEEPLTIPVKPPTPPAINYRNNYI